MASPIQERSVNLASFEKDALKIALGLCPDDRAKDSLLAALERAGMADGELSINTLQNQYLQRELPLLMCSDRILGTKLDSDVGKQLIPSLLERIQSGF